MSNRSLPGMPGWATPEEASARDEWYVHYEEALHSHRHIHSSHDFHYHRHAHLGGEMEHVHRVDEPIHEEHLQHAQYHLVGTGGVTI